MLRNYLLVTLRNIRNNKLFSFINIAGLAIGLSACFLIWQYVRFESSYDTFHQHRDRLYRVPFEIRENGELTNSIASTFSALGYSMKSSMPEVKDYTRLVKTSLFTNDLGKYVANALEFSRINESGNVVSFIEENVWFSDPSFLNMFSFKILEGTADALVEPHSIVLTRSIAKKYFGNTSALGRDLRLNSDEIYKVTAVIEDVPGNSHLQFDILLSFTTMRSRIGDMNDFWGWSVFYTYVLLEEGTNAAAVQEKLDEFAIKQFAREGNSTFKTSFVMEPILDIHLGSKYFGEQSPVGNERIVYFLSLLAVFILVVAWINYINLSTSKALQRSKEVGLRKTVGATRMQLITQFLFDTILINVLALILALVIVVVSWTSFEQLIGKQIGAIVFTGGVTPWFLAGAIFIVGVFICGVYPALTLSSFNPAAVLKGKFTKSSSGVFLRKLMVTFQYVLAILLIAGTVTTYLQLDHMRSLDTGFTKDQVIVTEAPAVFDSTSGHRISSYRSEMMKIQSVKNVTATSDVPGKHVVEQAGVMSTKSTDNNNYFGTYVCLIDSSFFSTFDIKILQGRLFDDKHRMTFRRQQKDELIPVLVNEEFVKRLGYTNLEDALEEPITFNWGPDMRMAKIVGVVANHHQVSFKEGMDAVMYAQPVWQDAQYFAARIEGVNAPDIEQIRTAFINSFPGHPFNYFFLDDHFDKQYRDDQQFGSIFNTFTVLAVIITCMGLLGLSIFSVTQRTKEISVRKVLGAPASAVLFIFSKDFIRALLISYAIAIPVIYWASSNWLANFPERIPLRWEIFATPLLFLATVTGVTVIAVCLRAMFEAPVRALRQD
jgi:putative ABC transport system permease protein